MSEPTIRLIQQQDYKNLFKLVSNNKSLFIRYFPITCANNETLEHSEKYVIDLVEKIEVKEMYAFGIFIEAKLVGIMYVKSIDWRIPKCELGYFLDPNYHGQGIMTNITLQTIDYCFSKLKMNKIFLRANPENIGSVRVAEKCGFEREGLLRKEFRIETEELVDNIYFGLLNPEID